MCRVEQGSHGLSRDLQTRGLRQCDILVLFASCSKMNLRPRTKSSSTSKSKQDFYEQRFNCMICLCPCLQMVWGLCQHHVCARCLYYESGALRDTFTKCPLCLHPHAFPSERPEIPEDNEEMMRCLGVRVCPRAHCDAQVWEWELDDHLLLCKALSPSLPMEGSTSASRSGPHSHTKGRKRPHPSGFTSEAPSREPYELRGHSHFK